MQPDPSPAVNSVPAPGGESKSFLASKTFWILLLGYAAPWLLKKFGLQFDEVAQQEAADKIVWGITSLGALWARGKAQGPLNFKVTPAAVVLAFAAVTLLLGGCASAPLKARLVSLANAEGKALLQIANNAADAEVKKFNAEIEKAAAGK